MERWRPWNHADADALRDVHGICFDIDDTFSTNGKITQEAYSALWRAADAGLTLVPVTGRPAGWCDHFARFWPVDAVVGENGAFVFFMQDGMRRRLNTPMQWTPQQAQTKLQELKTAVLKRFEHAQWSSDQAYREYDLAIDVCEDVEPWPEDDVQALIDVCTDHHAQVKLSSVHVNAWFGEYNKYAGFKNWLDHGAPGTATERPIAPSNWIYLGDSPNDAPMFERFAASVGVANIRPFRDRIECGPRWVTQGEGGAGFAQVVDTLLER